MNTTVYDLKIEKKETKQGQLFGLDPAKTFEFNKNDYQLIDFWDKLSDKFPEPHIRVWHTFSKEGQNHLKPKVIPVVLLNSSVLKELGVWELLSDEWKKKVENKAATIAAMTIEQKIENQENQTVPSTRRKYTDIPKEIICINCQEPIKVVPAQINTKLEKLGINIEKFVETFKCRFCDPKPRGRKANPLFAGIPKELTCRKCGSKTQSAPSNTHARAEAKGITVEEFLKQFVCQICEPRKRGRPAGCGKKPNPEYANVPKELVCKCGNKVAVAQSALVKRANDKGMTVEAFVGQYKCQICHPTKGRKPKGYVEATGVDSDKTQTPKNKFPLETTCIVCKSVIKIVKSNIEGKAKILGMTPMELVNNFKCRKCGGKITKAQKEASKEIV